MAVSLGSALLVTALATGPPASAATPAAVRLAGRQAPPATGEGALRTVPLAPSLHPGCLAETDSGALWALDQGNPFAMIEVQVSGPARTYPIAGPAPSDPGSQCLVVGPDGNLWFGDAEAPGAGSTAPAIARFDVSTGVTTFFRVPGGGADPQYLAAGDGVVWFLDTHNERIGNVTPSGAVAELSGRGLTDLSGLVVDGNGNLWVSGDDATGPALLEFSPSGRMLNRVTTPGTAGALVVGPGDVLWSTWGGGVFEVTPTLHVVDVIDDGIIFPASLAVGPDGRVWFASAWFGCLWSEYGYYSPSANTAVDYTAPGCAGNMAAGPAGVTFADGGDMLLELVGTSSPISSPLSTISTSTPTPAEALRPARTIVVNAGITAAVVLLLTFPSQLFNTTIEENSDRIQRLWRQRIRRVKLFRTVAQEARHAEGTANERLAFSGAVLLGALLLCVNDPTFGLSRASLYTYIAMVLTLVAGALLPALAIGLYHLRHHGSAPRQLRVVPSGLLVALGLLGFSRLINFEPGYLYGVVCTVFFTRKLTGSEEARVTALGTLTVIGASVVAWLIWVPVQSAAQGTGASPVLAIVADFLAGVFVSGLVGAFIGMAPVKGLPGWTIKRWSRRAWIIGYFLAGLGLFQVLLRPGIAGHTHRPLVTSIVLFVVFAAGSVAFHEYFEERKRKESGQPSPPWMDRLRALAGAARRDGAGPVPLDAAAAVPTPGQSQP